MLERPRRLCGDGWPPDRAVARIGSSRRAAYASEQSAQFGEKEQRHAGAPCVLDCAWWLSQSRVVRRV